MIIKTFKTHEIDTELRLKITDGFNESFAEQHTSEEELFRRYVKNVYGYSYHVVSLDDDEELVGFFTFNPYNYHNGIKMLYGGDTFVRQNYRSGSIMIFNKMIRELRKVCFQDGFQLETGVPNINAFKYATMINKDKYLCDLNYYILPIKPSKILKKAWLSCFDWLLYPFIWLWTLIITLLSTILNFKEKLVDFRLDIDEEFIKTSRFLEAPYKKYDSKNTSAIYRVMEDKGGVNVAYIIDFREDGKRSSKALSKAVLHILSKENVDAILFVGLLHLSQISLLKTPKKFVPQRLPLVYYILGGKTAEDFSGIENPANWDFSLINFDVR